MQKPCNKCDEWKSIEDFYKHPKMKEGRHNTCKACMVGDALESKRRRVKIKPPQESGKPHNIW